MRLLDHIAQSSAPLVIRQHDGARWQLRSAADFSSALIRCPLRWVLSDDLTRTCIALAYSGGAELAGCLDLLHLPCERLWIEWNEAARREALQSALVGTAIAHEPHILRAGVLLDAEPDFRRGRLRTFWLSEGAPREAILAPVETLLDLEGSSAPSAPDALLQGAAVGVNDPLNPPIDKLLQCARYRLEDSWAAYYRHAAGTATERSLVVQKSLAAVAFDVPLLLALFLLVAVRDDLIRQPVQRRRLNSKRHRLGRRPLLDHLELSAPVFSPLHSTPATSAGGARRAPRLHHVRGHLVRRHNTVYWRGPHWRGHVRLGTVRSRTVRLRLPQEATRAGTAPGGRGSAG
ncbi:MAG: hypothetical protein JO005_04820 [Gammaproteobacteria bacterium]|nr:hypothetical protein [Gammaproteobacteria bacterium]